MGAGGVGYEGSRRYLIKAKELEMDMTYSYKCTCTIYTMNVSNVIDVIKRYGTCGDPHPPVVSCMRYIFFRD